MTEHRFSRISAALVTAFSLSGMVTMAQAQTPSADDIRTTADEATGGVPLPMDDSVGQAKVDATVREAQIRLLRKQLRGELPQVEEATPLASVLQLGNARAYQYLDDLYPVTSISRGSGTPSPLASAPMNLDSIRIAHGDGTTVSFAEWQRNTVTDGLLVLHRGQVVYEKYHVGMSATQQHA